MTMVLTFNFLLAAKIYKNNSSIFCALAKTIEVTNQYILVLKYNEHFLYTYNSNMTIMHDNLHDVCIEEN